MRTILLSLVLLSGCAHAQTREVRTDRREKAVDHLQRADDRRDLIKIDALIARFDKARSNNNDVALRALDEELRRYVAQELRESRGELAQDVGELRRDNREVRGDRAELAGDRATGAGVIQKADDRHDLRDDKRDRRDDVRDAKREAAALAAKKRIATELDGLYGNTAPKSLDRKRTLMVHLDRLSRGEMVEDNMELREDRRETREDRREFREDVRQAN